MRMASNNHGNMQQKVNLSKSILNQVRIREGEGAVREIVREANRGR
jgi:hypothetical protein